MIERLRDFIQRHEGLRLKAYEDTRGNITIGYGRNLGARGLSGLEATWLLSDEEISQGFAEVLFQNDLESAIDSAEGIFHNFTDFPECCQIAIIDMIFNLGANGFLSFRRLIGFARAQDWERSAREVRNSQYYTQVGARADNIISLFREGKTDDDLQTDRWGGVDDAADRMYP